MSWITLAKSIYDQIYSHEDSFLFIEPVDIDDYPVNHSSNQPFALSSYLLQDYPAVISCPMDLSTVYSKLINGHYTSPLEFCNDMNLIFNNAKNYNQTRSQVSFITMATLMAVFIVSISDWLVI